MAIDEILLSRAQTPILRFYRWHRPSISFGYFVCFAEACLGAGDRAMVRRWTGGGIVPHGEDLTYSIIIGASDNAFLLPPRIIYQRVHAALSSALREMGITTFLTEADEPKLSEACFANPVLSDVIEDGRKIAGAAQRKTRNGLLHQGSIQRQSLNKEFRTLFSKFLCNKLICNDMNKDILRSSEEIAQAKYASQSWLRRR